MKQINKLEKLNTLGVSLVERGANKKKFSITKSEGIMQEADLEILQTILQDFPTDNESEVDEVFKSELPDKALNAIKGALRLIVAHKSMLPLDVMDKVAKLAGYPEMEKKEMPMDKEKMKEDEDKKKKEMEDMKDKEKDKMMKSDVDLSSIPEDLRSQFESLWKSNQENEKLLKEERELRQTREYIQKAKDLYSHVPSNTEKLGLLLKSAHNYSEDLGNQVEELLKSFSEVVKKSELLKELGSSHAVHSSGAAQELDSLAQGMIQKSDNKMSYSQAYDATMKQRPDLYQKYLSEHPKQR